MRSRRAQVAAGLLFLTLLAGCEKGGSGSSESGSGSSGSGSASGSVPDGWGTLRTDGVDVSYPSGWHEQSAARRSKYNAAEAVRESGGRTIGVMTVQLGFTQAESAEQAAIAAEAGIQMGADVGGEKDVKLRGLDSSDDAKRVDFTFKSTGQDGNPPKGTPIKGVILAGLDSSDKAFAIRIDAARGKLPPGDLTEIIDSVEVH